MLNSFKIGGNTTQVSFNSPSSGIIQKSHPSSKFIRFQVGSGLAKSILSVAEQPYFTLKTLCVDKIVPITVLQLMVFGENEILAEIVYNEHLKEEIII